MNSPQVWVALLTVIVTVLLAWLEQRKRDARLGRSEFSVFTPAPSESDAPDLPDDLLDEVVGCDGCDGLAAELFDRQGIIVRLQENNRILRELLSVTLSHIKRLECEAEAEAEAEGKG